MTPVFFILARAAPSFVVSLSTHKQDELMVLRWAQGERTLPRHWPMTIRLETMTEP